MEPIVVDTQVKNAEKLEQTIKWLRESAAEAFQPGFHGAMVVELLVKNGKATIRRTLKTTEL